MLRPSFTEHQIIAVIKSVDAGRPVKDACRVTGIAEATHYIVLDEYNLYLNQFLISLKNAIKLSLPFLSDEP